MASGRPNHLHKGIPTKQLLCAVLLMLGAQVMLADCYTYTVIWYQTTEYSDGTKSYKLLSIEDFTLCDVSSTPLPPDADVGGPVYTAPPSVSVAFVDTTDPYNPIVGVDVASNDTADQVAWVILEVNGTTRTVAATTATDVINSIWTT